MRFESFDENQGSLTWDYISISSTSGWRRRTRRRKAGRISM